MAEVSITEDLFGKTEEGLDVKRFTLTNKNRMVVRILNYGAIITDIIVPDKNGKFGDVNLGFDDMKGYLVNTPYIGAVIGRVANRIAGGKFTIDGISYSLHQNDGPNFIHGGKKGFSKVVWESSIQGNKLMLQYVSKDGEENFPGELTVVVTYELSDNNELTLDYTATTTKATPVNLTNHAYFNLAGHASGKLDDHTVTIKSDFFTPLDEAYIPTGEIKKVDGCLEDFRKPVRLGDCLYSMPGDKGFTVSYNLETEGKTQLAARVEHSPTGRFLECYTTEPSVMFYTSCYLGGTKGKGGTVYQKFGAFCLETQQYPDAVNHDNFPSTILRPGKTYRQTTTYTFGLMK